MRRVELRLPAHRIAPGQTIAISLRPNSRHRIVLPADAHPGHVIRLPDEADVEVVLVLSAAY